MTDTAVTSYDELPYGNHLFHYAHPDRLATFATLLGMTPAPVERCRVLELGCGTGFNLMPMAYALPESRFVGIDLSARQIEMGQEVKRTMALGNLELRAGSILDVDGALGEFDYIVCHGVYSWVPAAIQDKILGICAENLADNGVAYVSYNTYPGWHMRGMIREMMRFHVRQFSDPTTCVQQARALLEFLIEAAGDANSAYGRVLHLEAEMLEGMPDTYIYHEHLEEVNHPVYFHEFVERAGAKKLQYLAEAQPSLLPANLSPKVRDTLQRVSRDLIHAEQYLDFVRNGTFRRTLLCHDHVKLERPPNTRRVLGMNITGVVKPVTLDADMTSDAPVEFQTKKGTRLTTNHPIVKTALMALYEAWPQTVPFAELWQTVRVRLGLGDDEERQRTLADSLLQCFLGDIAELHVHAPRMTGGVSERPLASQLARLQALTVSQIANLRHRVVELNEMERQVLLLLDGANDREAVLKALVDLVAQDELEIHKDGQPIQDLAQVRAMISGTLDSTLHHIATSSLLLQ